MSNILQYKMRINCNGIRKEAQTSSRNSSPNFGFATTVYFENWPLKECFLVLAVALMIAVTSVLFLSSLGVSS
jgi:hypothetical protein